MAKGKVVSRKQLREEADAAEQSGAKGKKKTAKKTKAKRKSRSKKVAADVRMKLFWGVFSQSLKQVALYEFNQKKQAEKKAAELNASGKTAHFVQKVKKEIQLEVE
jgi:hypothetical protein